MKEFLMAIGIMFLFWITIAGAILIMYKMDDAAYARCIESKKPGWYCNYLIRD